MRKEEYYGLTFCIAKKLIRRIGEVKEWNPNSKKGSHMNSLHKLGKKPATYDKRDFQFAHYRTAAPLPPHPKQFGHEKLVARMRGRCLVTDLTILSRPDFWELAIVFLPGEIMNRCYGP